MTQSGLDNWAHTAEERPDGEAQAVAGTGRQGTSNVIDSETAGLTETSTSVEIAVTQVNYTVEGSGEREEPIVHVFGRTSGQEATHVRVRGFRPYFYAPTASLSDDALDDDRLTGWEETDENGDPYVSIRGERLTRIYGQTPRDVGNVRDRFDHYEADILFPNRLLIDKGIQSGIRVPDRRNADGAIDVHHTEIEPVELLVTPRVHTMDIEVNDRAGFPEEGEEPILCLTSHDSYRDEYVAWLYVAPEGDGTTPDGLPNHELLREDADLDLRCFDDEPGMLDDYLAYVEETDPDIITGWNVDDFDAPYLLDRLERLAPRTDHDLAVERLSRVDEVWRSDWQGPNIKGRVVFDLLYAYRRTQFTELDSYRLDAVAEAEVGEGKERYTGSIGDLWERDPVRLLEYNVRDVELCVEIDDRRDLIPFWQEVRTFVGCKLEDAPTPGDAVDVYVLHKVHGKFVLPSKGRVESEEFEGGAVFDPITGVRENVSVLDLKSLYPMCMVTINASPETKVDDDYDGPTYRAPNGMRFRREPEGIIREMVDELLTERERKKEFRDHHTAGTEEYEVYDRQQAAVKVIMNSLYGVTGWERFRLYDKDVAGAVTATGREAIRHTEQAANEFGYEVVYGDTDSVMLELGPDLSKDEAVERAFEIEAHINASYDDFARETLDADVHRFQIEFEKLYRRFFQAGRKKRYAGHIVWKEGQDVDDVDITGFEYKRSDIAPITKRVQKEVIERIVHGEEISAVTAYVADVIEEFQRGEADLDDIGIPGGIGKRLDDYDTDTAHVRGSKYANRLLGTNFQRGSKPKRYYLKKVHPTFFERMESERGLDPRRDPVYGEFKRDPDVICIEYADQFPEEFEVDWEIMLEKTLKGPISRVLEALDVSWEEIKSGQQQTGLGQFG